MKPIPSDLLQKLSENLQTQFNGADPRIYLVMRRTDRYIEQGSLLDPKTILDTPPGTDLGSWDLALSRPVALYKTYPDYIYRIHQDDGSAVVTRVEYDTMIDALTKEKDFEALDFNWEDLSWPIADAVEVAIEFNGYWVKTAKDAEVCFDSPARWTFVTEGEPWAIWTDSDGKLFAQQGYDGSISQLRDGGVGKISAIRGWKSRLEPQRDQGLIVAYIRDNTVRYRTYAQQADESWIWESEKDTTKAAVDVGVSRTNDYRTAILYETAGGEIHWLITDRRWAGMAIPDEYILATITDLDYSLTRIHHTVVGDGPYPTTDPRSQENKWRWGEHDSETITASIVDYTLGPLLWGVATEPVELDNYAVQDSVTGEDVGTGDGTATQFDLQHTPDADSETVYLDGSPTTDYSITGKTITFDSAPGNGVAITADYNWQNWGKRIRITFDHGITNTDNLDDYFFVTDEADNGYSVNVTEGGDIYEDPLDPKKFDGTRELILHVDYNNAANSGTDVTVEYQNGAGRLQGEAGQDLAGFNETFTPDNLSPYGDPPEVEDVWNE